MRTDLGIVKSSEVTIVRIAALIKEEPRWSTDLSPELRYGMARGTLRAMFVSFILLFAIPDLTKPCIYLLNQGWKQKSVGERAKLVDVVFTGKVRRLYSLNELSQTYAADFEVLQVLKGRDIVDQVIDIHSSSQLKVFGFGEKRLCFSPVRPGEIHMVFAVYSPNTNVNLVARYDDIFGATSSVTKQNEDEVLNVLGK